MCIAILKPKGAKITDEALTNAFNHNKDGAGLAYTVNDTIYIQKGIFNLKTFINAVRTAEEKAEKDMLIHCRIGTSGLLDKNNCHPHIISEQCVLIHNGMLDIDVPKESNVSDTVIFIEKYLKPLDKDFYNNPALLGLIEQAIGSYNKFVLLPNSGEGIIINEQAGIWDNGVWYSNETYKTQKIINLNSFNNYTYNWYDNPQEQAYYEDYYAIEEWLDEATDDELLELDGYPMWDTFREILVPYQAEMEKHKNRYISLYEIDPKLYEEYYNEMGIRGLNKRKAGVQ